MSKVKVTVEENPKGVYCFEEGDGHYINAYLIVGEESAVLIDTLCECEDLYSRVREITELPLTVLITHGHGDHAGASTRAFKEAGCDIYMMLSDLPVLNAMSGGYEEDFFKPLYDGMEFELAGIKLSVIAVPGHTPGSVAFHCREREWLFSGDTVGSGNFWMQIPFCEPLSVLLKGVSRLYDIVKDESNLKLFTGHRYQAPHQLGLDYIKDVMDLTEELVSGKLKGEEQAMDFHGNKMIYRVVSRGDMSGYCYDPERL